MARTFVYVAAAEARTIDVFGLDQQTGVLTPLGSCPAGANVMPMALGPDRRHLYASIRSEPLRVASFAIDPSTGLLREAASAPLPANMPYISTALDGRLLLAASYASAVAAVLPIDLDGCVRSAATQTLPTGPNAHAILTDRSGRFVFVPCLGSDVVMRYRLDAAAGRLEPLDPPTIALPSGFGPRHLRLSADNQTLFVLGEFTGGIARLAFDARTGSLSLAGVTPTVAPGAGLRPGRYGEADRTGAIWAADLQITPDGRFFYATERTGGTIAVLAVAGDALRLLGHHATEAQPRGIGIDPSGRFLVASGERSDRIASYAIDQASGALSLISRAPVGAGANWVEIATLD